MRFPIVGGSYVARSIIANVQRCVNYFPELNREDSPVPFTYYQRPGLTPQAQGPIAPVRMLYRASNGVGYACIGSGIYLINPDWSLELLGSLASSGSTPVRAIDNGGFMIIADGSPNGWQVDLSSNIFSQVEDPTGTFTGATTFAILDTYILWNMPGTVFFGSTLSNDIAFDPLYFAGKVGYPDLLIGLTVNRHEIILFGSLKSEIWYNAGNPTFPFAQLPGAYIEHGCLAPYSIQSMDIQTYWLGQDLQGNAVVFALRGYDVRRVSNHALENELQKLGDLSDAISYTYQQGGHYFYVLTFPSADQTWVYDSSLEKDPEMAWHQRGWTDSDGVIHRERAMSGAFINGKNVVGDWENGTIYLLDQDAYVDNVDGEPGPITFIKGFPHLLQAPNAAGQMVGTDFKRIQFSRFIADLECGMVPLDADGNPAKIGLRTSHDRGRTWGETVLQSAGALGEYLTNPIWQPLGIARDIVFELEHSIAGPAALNGCFVEAQLLDT